MEAAVNILYLINYAGSAGTEKYVENLLGAAARAGHRCHLGYCVPGPLSEKAAAAGCSTLRLDMSPKRVLFAARELARYCRDQGVEVIHAQYPRENVIAVLARGFYRPLRVVFTSHLTIRQGRSWRYVNRLVTPHDHCVISVCRQGAALLAENGVCRERIRVIPNGIRPGREPARENAIRQEFDLSEETFLFVTMARYAPEKGLGWLLKVLVRLKERTIRPFVCLIAGEGAEYELIARRVRDLGLTENIIQAGYRADGTRLLASADAYVSTALYNEAMSFAILEAMGCALPLAVTDVGAGAELAAGCGFACAPGDTEAMAENLRRLLEDESLCRRLGKAAREKVCRDYDLETLLQRTLECYI